MRSTEAIALVNVLLKYLFSCRQKVHVLCISHGGGGRGGSDGFYFAIQAIHPSPQVN